MVIGHKVQDYGASAGWCRNSKTFTLSVITGIYLIHTFIKDTCKCEVEMHMQRTVRGETKLNKWIQDT